MLHIFCVFHKIPDAAGNGKISEHFLIVGGIAEINRAFRGIFDSVVLSEEKKAHGKLVVIAEPGVDVDGADVSICTGGFYRRKNLLRFLEGKAVVLVLRIVECKIVEEPGDD